MMNSESNTKPLAKNSDIGLARAGRSKPVSERPWRDVIDILRRGDLRYRQLENRLSRRRLDAPLPASLSWLIRRGFVERVGNRFRRTTAGIEAFRATRPVKGRI